MKILTRVQHLKNQAIIADKCDVADSFVVRLKGLIGKPRLLTGEAMFFPRCNSVHMWFMRFPIDVVFVRPLNGPAEAKVFEVSSTRECIRPWKFWPVADWSASDALELPAGSVRAHGIGAGDRLCIG